MVVFQDDEKAKQDAEERLTIGFGEFTREIEAEIDRRVTAAVAPLLKEIAELTERVLCLEQSHGMAPSDYCKSCESLHTT